MTSENYWLGNTSKNYILNEFHSFRFHEMLEFWGQILVFPYNFWQNITKNNLLVLEKQFEAKL